MKLVKCLEMGPNIPQEEIAENRVGIGRIKKLRQSRKSPEGNNHEMPEVFLKLRDCF